MDQFVFFSLNVAETTKTGGLLSRTSKVQKKNALSYQVFFLPFLFSSLSYFRSMGSLQQALVCFEKRLVVAHELGGEGEGKAQAYGELGTLHSQLGNYEQALSCLEHQLNIARIAGVGFHQQNVLVSVSYFVLPC